MRVSLDLGYGQKFYEWFTDFTREDLIEFWESIEDIEEYTRKNKALPGKLVQTEGLFDNQAYAVLDSNHNSFLIDGKTGQAYYHRGFNE